MINLISLMTLTSIYAYMTGMRIITVISNPYNPSNPDNPICLATTSRLTICVVVVLCGGYIAFKVNGKKKESTTPKSSTFITPNHL